jgi:hypothetical protein
MMTQTKTPSAFATLCASACKRLNTDRLNSVQLAAVRGELRATRAAAAEASMVGRTAISVGASTVHLSTATSRVRVLFGRDATPAEIALAIRARIAALELRSVLFTGELAHRAAGQLATMRSRLASL